MNQASDPAVHLIGNAHIDPVWIWNWREGMHEVWATFRSALDRLREYPDFCFTASSAAYYAWIEAVDPGMFAEIQQYVSAGRWAVVGGMWVEPDCNLPSGESFCRHTLYSQRYFRRAFGRPTTVGYNVDSFGHNAGLPQILALSGMPYYVMMRPGEHEKDLPGPLFRWRGADGREVLTYRIPRGYGSPGGADQHVLTERLAYFAEAAAAKGEPLMMFYGVGNHGGGPTRHTLDALGAACREDPGLLFSRPGPYFEALAERGPIERFPVVEGDLQHHASGCYSVTGWIKSANHRSERLLGVSEQLDAIAHQVWGRPAHGEVLAQAWKAVLFNQFHDILAGTSSDPAYESVRRFYGLAETTADRIEALAMETLARHIDTRAPKGASEPGAEPDFVPVLLYNPLAWPVRRAVSVERPAGTVRDAAGRVVPSQAVPSGEQTRFATHVLFVADLPPMGYHVYWIGGGGKVRVSRPEPWDGAALENDAFRLEIDPGSGAVKSLWDKRQNRQVLDSAEGGIRPVVLYDPSDTWSHGVFDYGRDEEAMDFLGAERVESGPVRQTVRLHYARGASRLQLDVSLYEGFDWVEWRGKVDWHEGHALLKIRMPWNLLGPAATVAGAAYGVVRRAPTGEEEPVQGWVAVEAEGIGVGVTTGDRQSYDVRERVLRLTILRSPWVADHGRGWAGDDPAYPFTDQGTQAFTFRVHPYRGRLAGADLPRRALEQETHAPLLVDTFHAGDLAGRGSLLEVSGAGVVVGAVKRAEAGDALVVRLWESRGERTTVSVGGPALGQRTASVELNPYELVTLLVPDDADRPVETVDITEEGPVAAE